MQTFLPKKNSCFQKALSWSASLGIKFMYAKRYLVYERS